MSAETDLYSALSTDAALAAVIEEKIFSDIADEEVEPPFIYYEKINSEAFNTIHGGAPFAEISEIAVVCFSESREEAESIANLAMLAATNNDFVYTGSESEYEEEQKLYASLIQLKHFQSN